MRRDYFEVKNLRELGNRLSRFASNPLDDEKSQCSTEDGHDRWAIPFFLKEKYKIRTTEQVQKVTSAATHKRHKDRPKCHSRSITCIAPSGSTIIPTRKSVRPRFQTNSVVLVRPTRALKQSTNKLPNVVNTKMTHAATANNITNASGIGDDFWCIWACKHSHQLFTMKLFIQLLKMLSF